MNNKLNITFNKIKKIKGESGTLHSYGRKEERYKILETTLNKS